MNQSELIDIVTTALGALDRLFEDAYLAVAARAQVSAARQSMTSLLGRVQGPVALEPGQAAALRDAQLKLSQVEKSTTGSAQQALEAASTIQAILGSISYLLPGDDPTQPKG